MHYINIGSYLTKNTQPLHYINIGSYLTKNTQPMHYINIGSYLTKNTQPLHYINQSAVAVHRRLLFVAKTLRKKNMKLSSL